MIAALRGRSELAAGLVDAFQQILGALLHVVRRFRGGRFLPALDCSVERGANAGDRTARGNRGDCHLRELTDRLPPRHAVGRIDRDPRILFDHDFFRLFIFSNSDFDGVLPRIDARAAREPPKPAAPAPARLRGRCAARNATARRRLGCGLARLSLSPTSRGCSAGGFFAARRRGHRACAEIPHHAIDARLFRAVHLAHDFSGAVGDGDAHLIFFVGLALQVVVDDCAVRRIRPEKHLLPGIGAAIRDAPFGRRTQVEEMQVFRGDRIGPLLERCDVVEDPDRSSVGAEDQVVFAGVDGDVVDRNGRQIQFQLRPVRALIVRHEERALGAREQELRIAVVLADDMQRAVAVRDSGANQLPGLAVIAGHESEDIEIVAAVVVEGQVRGSFIVSRCDDAADVTSFRNAFHFFGDVLPGLSAVARDVKIAVVGTDPQQVFVRRRFADGRDRRPCLHSVVTG